MMADADNDGLFALFASECGAHLDAILAAAARTVELLDLEYLCRAMEALAAADEWTPARLAFLDEALTLLPQLSAPTGRLRNQMMALAARCHAAAGQAAGASS